MSKAPTRIADAAAHSDKDDCPGLPEAINYDLEESLELLTAFEDGRDPLADSDYLEVVAKVDHEIAPLSHKLGFDRPSGGGDGR
jgi:hypothetical protein